ncbi:hypothetical protein XAB3213_1050004 [Xanthomonas citri pv. bilvae]|nr:hypothetical protein XAB3213_1050004 [Xanthomonas citri pv. bilvae]
MGRAWSVCWRVRAWRGRGFGRRCAGRQVVGGQKAFDVVSCRKAGVSDSFLRELVIGFSASGYVLLFEVASDQVVTAWRSGIGVKTTIIRRQVNR